MVAASWKNLVLLETSIVVSATLYPGSQRVAVSCCNQTVPSLAKIFHDNTSTLITRGTTTDSAVYPECQLLNLLPDSEEAACSSSGSSMTVGEVLRGSDQAQKRLSEGNPLVGALLEAGKCMDFTAQSTAAVEAEGTAKDWYWNTLPRAALSHPTTDSVCERTSVPIGNISNRTMFLAFGLRCPMTAAGGLGVRLSWLPEEEKSKNMCEAGAAQLEKTLRGGDWVVDPGMPRWSCLDVSAQEMGMEAGPAYRLLLTSVGPTPCEAEPATTTTSASTTTSHSSSAFTLSPASCFMTAFAVAFFLTS
eukprot:TRINITY_DN9183_c0_g1_i4.p1 TRINITY_DN9183_c0_g1~~TRINITY_DN9183_c0_g1_i4.p1  ORF type:complete len:305 (-),score=31.50 TRINITY_DN9183_c0_g1_i4:223-1137(-)